MDFTIVATKNLRIASPTEEGCRSVCDMLQLCNVTPVPITKDITKKMLPITSWAINGTLLSLLPTKPLILCINRSGLPYFFCANSIEEIENLIQYLLGISILSILSNLKDFRVLQFSSGKFRKIQ